MRGAERLRAVLTAASCTMQLAVKIEKRKEWSSVKQEYKVRYGMPSFMSRNWFPALPARSHWPHM